jgi:CHASE1-domain containing sensor protein
MSPLVEFLLARVDDEEAELRTESRRRARSGTDGSSALSLTDEDDAAAQRRAELAARREMVGILQRMMVLHDLPAERPQRDSAAQLLKLMAVPYMTHPSYRIEWRP